MISNGKDLIYCARSMLCQLFVKRQHRSNVHRGFQQRQGLDDKAF